MRHGSISNPPSSRSHRSVSPASFHGTDDMGYPFVSPIRECQRSSQRYTLTTVFRTRWFCALAIGGRGVLSVGDARVIRAPQWLLDSCFHARPLGTFDRGITAGRVAVGHDRETGCHEATARRSSSHPNRPGTGAIDSRKPPSGEGRRYGSQEVSSNDTEQSSPLNIGPTTGVGVRVWRV